MGTPHVPGSQPDTIDLPCEAHASPGAFDLGMREYTCECGEEHAVVMDVHPPSRFFPSDVVSVLQSTIEPVDGESFGTRHLMGMVLEEFPDAVVGNDVSEDGQLGCGYLWVCAFDSRRLHEIIVELMLEVMEHAMSHAADDDARTSFTDHLSDFDVETFVTRYREERDIEWPA